MVILHDRAAESHFSVMAGACEGGYYCPVGHALAIHSVAKVASSSVAKWVAALCNATGTNSSLTLAGAFTLLGKSWPWTDRRDATIFQAQVNLVPSISSGYSGHHGNLTLNDLHVLGLTMTVPAVMDMNEPLNKIYMEQLQPKGAANSTVPRVIRHFPFPCCRFGTDRLHLFFVRNPFQRVISEYMHGGRTPAQFGHYMKLRFPELKSQYKAVQQMLDIGDEVLDQRMLFAQRGALLIHLEVLNEDLSHAQQCLCLIYADCFQFPAFPRTNVGKNRTLQEKRMDTNAYWTKEHLQQFFAHLGGAELSFLGYSARPDLKAPRETLRLCN